MLHLVVHLSARFLREQVQPQVPTEKAPGNSARPYANRVRVSHPDAVTDLVLQAATAADCARPALAATGTTHDARAETTLARIAVGSLIAGAGTLRLGRRLRCSRPDGARARRSFQCHQRP